MKDELKQALRNKLEKLGLPAPDKLVSEVQRLNNNLEEVAPRLKRLEEFLDGMTAKEFLEGLEKFSALWSK